MQIVLLWKNRSDDAHGPSIDTVVQRLRSLFEPLAGTDCNVHCRINSATSLVYLEVPVVNWAGRYFEEDESTWAMSVDFPYDSSRIIAPVAANDSPGLLPRLCRTMQQEPQRLLEGLAPHFCLIWSSRGDDSTYVQNDGLGFCQAYEYDDGRVWALSNKPAAFTALGVPLRPDAQQWAVKLSLGFFH